MKDRTDMGWTWRTLLAAGCAVLLTATAVHAQATRRDAVSLTNKQILSNVTVLSENYKEVAVDTTGDGQADRTIPQNEVLRVEYGDAPRAFQVGIGQMRLGNQYDKALEQFQAAGSASGVRPWLNDYVAYYSAECVRMQSESKPVLLADAAKRYQDALTGSPEGPFRDGLLYGLGRVLLAQGNPQEAAKQFDLLRRTGVKQEFKQGAELGLADIQTKEGRPAEALKLYEGVVQRGEGQSADVYRQAVLGKSRAMVALKQYTDAATFLQRVLKTTRSVPLLTEGYMGLGDCYYELAESLKDPKDARNAYKEALFAYLRVEVLYPQDANSLAKALFYAGKCFQNLQQDDRAREKWALLRSKFPTSPWLDKIK